MFDLLVPGTEDSPAVTITPFGRWSCCSHAPGTISHPEQLDDVASNWLSAAVPGTVASALSDAAKWDMQQPPGIDSLDWWYRTTFVVPDDCETRSRYSLCFDGLATLAEVWLNGDLLITTDNMFRTYQIDVARLLKAENELVIGFRSLSADLQKKRPRPRWKTNLVNQQQLRWRRTTLLGRIPGWSPPVPVIGPWRDVRLEQSSVSLTNVRLNTQLEGDTGLVTIQAELHSSLTVDRVHLRVGDVQCELKLGESTNGQSLSGTLSVSQAPLWWPHTHGSQPLLACQIIVESDSMRYQIDCGRVGFRTLKVQRDPQFALTVNGQSIYCRGACWTVSNVFTLSGTEESLRRDLSLAREAGVNMLRVIGTMTYESDLFFQLCDELGIMVWQDFMFANMDYPVDDPAFAENIRAEATDQLRRLSSHPSVAIYCGNSEIEQQAAMLGLPSTLWTNTWFAEILPQLCAELHPGTEYIRSTPTGGVLPFHASAGITHYYGVGAYLRSPAELRQADVKFTPECLGFANIPEPDTINAITEGALTVVHHPKWKQRVPRDTGAGWDFEDVRDHYLKEVYGVDPVLLRSSDTPRYLELSRVVSGEMMARTFSEWRSNHSRNQGGLVWFFKDLWPAAGWGLVDSTSQPKAAYYFLKRTWRNRQITMTDEGLNGLHLHVINETAEPLTGFVEVTLLKEPNVIVARKEVSLDLAARQKALLNADEILGGFYDVSYAYRFGPAHHDVAVATLFDADHQPLSEAFHFVRRRESNIVPVAIEAVAERNDAAEYLVTLSSDRFLHNVRLSAPGYRPDDNYFHLISQRKKVVRFAATGASPKAFRADIEALNLETPITVTFLGSRD